MPSGCKVKSVPAKVPVRAALAHSGELYVTEGGLSGIGAGSGEALASANSVVRIGVGWRR